MDFRILIAIAFGLVAVAFGGFYFAFGSRSHESLVAQQAPVRTGASSTASPAAPGASQPSAAPQPSAAQSPAPEPPAVRPGKATPESIEAEIAKSDHAELQSLLKKNFPDDYKALIAVAVDRRNEG